ncbi:hypothetical protein L6452_13899 [Arctium lappa]|uniref:Uncharacterized protein n=1 Tax=Arctium lappa TaxID=4217 RepID=A0ACB9CJH2_ARCLA|nr:hypothetical protein L6452_13899 [Arctium lappa]
MMKPTSGLGLIQFRDTFRSADAFPMYSFHPGSNGDLNSRRHEHPVKIPGADLRNAVDGSAKVAQFSQRIMPLYMGALFEKHKIVKYPHHASQTMMLISFEVEKRTPRFVFLSMKRQI